MMENIKKGIPALEAIERNNDGIMDILIAKETNDYINMSHTITKADLVDVECGSVLRDYERTRVYLKEEMRRCKVKESNMSLYKIKSLLQAINDDMILAAPIIY